jgi:hypothetical protein
VGAIVCTKVLNLLSSSGLQSFSACRGNSQLQRGGIKIKARKGALQYAHSKSPLANKKKRFRVLFLFYFSIFQFFASRLNTIVGSFINEWFDSKRFLPLIQPFS